jgi:S-DNA-T family DNA segregation ATPase FtsK/SpoIIIE
MAKKENSQKNRSKNNPPVETEEVVSTPSMSPQTKRSLVGITLLILALLIILGTFGIAGVVGTFLFKTVFWSLFGFGVVMIPVIIIIYAIHLFRGETNPWTLLEYITATLFGFSLLGLVHVISPQLQAGGIVGKGVGSGMIALVDVYAAGIILAIIAIVSLIIFINEELRVPSLFTNLFQRKSKNSFEEDEIDYEGSTTLTAEELEAYDDEGGEIDEDETATSSPVMSDMVSPTKAQAKESSQKKAEEKEEEMIIGQSSLISETYEYPPTDLLGKSSGKPSVGDIKANANLIKRTLLNFGIDVEMDEVSIGPTVTRYALKPAEGIKLSRILALKSDLALSLAAHPIRIEAPIPGKSLVGIEIPNKTKSTVGLGSLLEEDTFENSADRLMVALGKGVTGKTYYSNLAKMPHLLIAGTTGSGKSITVHNLILSLLYRNGPEDLRLIMVDPKRVELTLYNDIPHLLTPVIKEPKKAILALKWAAKEMERRYDLLEKHSCRDIQSYHKNVLEPSLSKKKVLKEGESPTERMPYIVIFIDELADIMQAYPRELEAGIVRLAQMSRAVGIHLVLSTQRPSVNVITGLIKANVPSRLALQVASQIDSRTILDAPGAESLLGKGDMLFQSAEMSKPERMQCAFVSEEQVKAVVSFIKKHNQQLPDEIVLGEIIDDDRSISSSMVEGDNDEDELYEDARAVVMEAGKASTSYIQRKLKVGYSRAARLIDLLEERGIVGPADGAKPREVIQGYQAADVAERIQQEMLDAAQED